MSTPNPINLNNLDGRYSKPSDVVAAIAAQDATDATTYAPQNNPTLNGTTTINGSLILKRTAVSDVNYTVVPTDNIIEYTALTAARTVTLPTAVGIAGKLYMIKDASNSANTYVITIVTVSSQTIDGATTQTISKNFGEIVLYSDGANWRIQSKDNYYASGATDIGTLLANIGYRASGASLSFGTNGGGISTGAGAISATAGTITGFNVVSNGTMTAKSSLGVLGTLNPQASVQFTPTTVTTSVTLTLTSTEYQYVNSASAVTITLPATTSAGYRFTIKNINTATVTVSGTIDGVSGYALSAQYKYVSIMSTTVSGTWYVVANN